MIEEGAKPRIGDDAMVRALIIPEEHDLDHNLRPKQRAGARRKTSADVMALPLLLLENASAKNLQQNRSAMLGGTLEREGCYPAVLPTLGFQNHRVDKFMAGRKILKVLARECGRAGEGTSNQPDLVVGAGPDLQSITADVE